MCRPWLARAVLACVAACAPQAAAETVILSGSVVGPGPATIGYNVGDFTNNNTASWWRYSGVNGGRIFSAPATLTPADTVFKSSTNAALDATTQAQFVTQRAALRASGTSTTYIRWSTASTNYTTSASYGNNTIDMEFADAAIRDAGGTSLVVMQRSTSTYPWPSSSSSNTAADWQARWLAWQQWYAQAFMRARYNDVATFQFFNEPDLYSGSLTQSQWIEMMQYGADATQAAVADVNRIFGKSLVAKISGPVTNGPSLTPSGTGHDWGDTLLAFRSTPVLSATAVPGYQLFNQYDYHNYGSSPETFGTKLEGAIFDVNAQTGGQAGQYAFTLSEYNTRTSANYAPNDPVNNPNGFTPDSLAMSSRLGQIDVNLANAGADGLYLFKFSDAGGANNGVHWQSTAGEVGGATKSAMVHRLFAEGFVGNSLLAAPQITGTEVSMAATLNPATGTRYLFAANADLAAGTSLTIDLSGWNTPVGALVTVEQVSDLHQGDISQSITVGADRTITVNADPGGVVLVRVPSRGLETTAVVASNDAYVNQGSGNTSFNGPELLVRNSGTSKSQRDVAYLKFPVDVSDPSRVTEAILRIYARDPNATSTGSAGIITHVYGLTNNSWSEGSITWNNAPNLSDPPTNISTIGQNYVGGVGTSSEIIGQFAATSTEQWLSIDVSRWVLERLAQGASSLSFLIAREIRYDGDVDSSQWLSIRSTEYGDGSFGPQLMFVAVPEPSPLGLIASAAVGLGLAPRQRRASRRRPAASPRRSSRTVIVAACFLMACFGGVVRGQDALKPAPPLPAKKGVGLSERRGLGEKQLQDLRVGWFYNWGAKTGAEVTDVTFVPMIYSAHRLENPVSGPRLLGFNEPDHAKQADMPVEEALRLWPSVARKARLVGAPAMAGNPVTGDWLPRFMAAGPRVDFMTLHWYKGANAKKFIADVEALHEKYGKPVWITEFAPQTAASSAENPGKFTQDEVDRFIADVTKWMESKPWVEAYAWHDSRAGTSALFDAEGGMTATGRAYARAGGTAGRMTVVFVGADKISVKPGNGKDKAVESTKYKVTAETTITVDGAPAALTAIKPGHKVVIVARADDAGVAAAITVAKSPAK